MIESSIRFSTFPKTDPPPEFVKEIISIFRQHESKIATSNLKKGLTSDQVLNVLSTDLKRIGFDIETGKNDDQKIKRPVFYGENGIPTVQYEIDGFHTEWRCGLEIEAGRAWKGNAVYRDLILALVMVKVENLCLAVPNIYRFKSGGKNQKK